MFSRIVKVGLGLVIAGAVLPLSATSAHADTVRLEIDSTPSYVFMTAPRPFISSVRLAFNNGVILSSVPLDVTAGPCVDLGHTPWGYAADCTKVKVFFLQTSRGDDNIVADVGSGENVSLFGDSGNDKISVNTAARATAAVYGEDGDDTLSASGAGNNIARGERGNDTITNFNHAFGGVGADTFYEVNGRADGIDCGGNDGAVDVVHRDLGRDKLSRCASNDQKLNS